MTNEKARNYQTRIADQTNGEMGSKLIQKWVGARLRPRMTTAAILDVMETDLRRGYELMGLDFRVSSGGSVCLCGLTDGDPTSAAFKNGGLLVVSPSDR